MTATVGTATLNLTGQTETSEFVGPEWFAWEEGAVKRKTYIYARKRVWTLSCVERDVAWSDSAAKYLQDQGADGNILALTIDEGSRYQVTNVNVYVTSVEIDVKLTGTQNIRHFTITLKEV